jgi:hypothetical protein
MQTKIIADTLYKLEKGIIDYTEVEPALWKNREFALAAAKQDLVMLIHVDDSLKKDMTFMLTAMETNWRAFIFADDSLLKNKKFKRTVQSILDAQREADSADFHYLHNLNALRLSARFETDPADVQYLLNMKKQREAQRTVAPDFHYLNSIDNQKKIQNIPNNQEETQNTIYIQRKIIDFEKYKIEHPRPEG